MPKSLNISSRLPLWLRVWRRKPLVCVWSVGSNTLSFYIGTGCRIKVVWNSLKSLQPGCEGACREFMAVISELYYSDISSDGVKQLLTAGATVRAAFFLTDSKHHSIVLSLLAFGWMTETSCKTKAWKKRCFAPGITSRLLHPSYKYAIAV